MGNGSRTVQSIVEVCAASLEVCVAAEAAGADRIELNSALELDGLTPSPGLVHQVKEAVSIPVIAMLRPRSGNFVYSDSEWSTMCRDLEWLLEAGIDGIAFGCLDTDGRLQNSRIEQLRSLVNSDRTGFELVFHRAFDDCSQSDVVSRMADLGVDRVMTSGGAKSAEEGLKKIRQTVDDAADRIGVIPAAGITAANVSRILESGCGQIHGTFGTRSSEDPVVEIRKVMTAVRDSVDRAVSPE